MGLITSYFYSTITYEEEVTQLHKLLYTYKEMYEKLVCITEQDKAIRIEMKTSIFNLAELRNTVNINYTTINNISKEESSAYYNLQKHFYNIRYGNNLKIFNNNSLYQKLYNSFQNISNVKSYYYGPNDYINSKEVKDFFIIADMYIA